MSDVSNYAVSYTKYLSFTAIADTIPPTPIMDEALRTNDATGISLNLIHQPIVEMLFGSDFYMFKADCYR